MCMNFKTLFITAHILIFTTHFQNVALAQNTAYDSLSALFNRFVGSADYDAAFIVSRKMQIVACNNGSDTFLQDAFVNRFMGFLCVKMGWIDSALTYYHKSKQLLEFQGRSEDPDYAKLLVNIGALWEETGDYKKAAPYYSQSFEIRKRIFGIHHQDVIEVMSRLGGIGVVREVI